MTEKNMSKQQQLSELITKEYETELQPRPNDEDDRKEDSKPKTDEKQQSQDTDTNENNNNNISIQSTQSEEIKENTNYNEPPSPPASPINTQATAGLDRDADITGPKRASTQFTRRKIACWFSMDLHLVDIRLASETFEVNAWLLVFFHDPNHDFAELFDSETLESIRQQGKNPCSMITN